MLTDDVGAPWFCPEPQREKLLPLRQSSMRVLLPPNTEARSKAEADVIAAVERKAAVRVA